MYICTYIVHVHVHTVYMYICTYIVHVHVHMYIQCTCTCTYVHTVYIQCTCTSVTTSLTTCFRIGEEEYTYTCTSVQCVNLQMAENFDGIDFPDGRSIMEQAVASAVTRVDVDVTTLDVVAQQIVIGNVHGVECVLKRAGGSALTVVGDRETDI